MKTDEKIDFIYYNWVNGNMKDTITAVKKLRKKDLIDLFCRYNERELTDFQKFIYRIIVL